MLLTDKQTKAKTTFVGQ